MNLKKWLQIRQIDDKILSVKGIENISLPREGWIHALRNALGMTLEQLGRKLSMTKQSVRDLERREKEGSVTIRAMREAAEALDMQFVYALIPKDGSLENLVNRKAEELATKVVQRTNQSMLLEDQAITYSRKEKAISERANVLKQDLPKALWD